jgi:hypothetical protein
MDNLYELEIEANLAKNMQNDGKGKKDTRNAKSMAQDDECQSNASED